MNASTPTDGGRTANAVPLPARVLVMDDDPDVLLSVRMVLKPYVEAVRCESDPDALPGLLEDGRWDVFLLDMNFSPGDHSGQQGMSLLRQLLAVDPACVVVLMTAYGGVETAIEAIREGATDFVLKPWQNEKLLATIGAAAKLALTRREVRALKTREREIQRAQWTSGPIIGQSEPMNQVFRLVAKSAPTEANVLILGENGTGKELIARELHERSDRSAQVFMSVDLGAVPESLFESELFGHIRGAFTDARSDRIGRIQAAAGGTLFLDEIGNLPLFLQSKLLSALEQRSVTPVGSDRAVPVDVRLVCATNRDLAGMVAEGTFREDLLYRINTVEIALPPLRERPDDIPLLLEHFAAEYARKYQQPRKRFSRSALAHLQQYDWPGNVRELRHAVERAVILGEEDVFCVDDFPLRPGAGSSVTDNRLDAGLNLEALEEHAIRQAMKREGGNVSRAARALGISRASLYRRMEKYGL